jgi:two-component system sensor histidine kinase UhpB
MLIINLFLMRRAFKPLERMTDLMRTVDPLKPGRRIPVYGGGAEVVDLTRAFNEMLDRLETERREYARRSLAADEQERRRLARELHDEIGQMITALMLQLNSAAKNIPDEPRARLVEAADAGRTALDNLHRILGELRPEALDDLGLARAVDSLCERMSASAPITIDRSLEPNLTYLTAEEELVIYRVAQESLTNIVRHADATVARISLLGGRDEIVLDVRDDGIGLREDYKPGEGIRGMRERALLIGAELSIESPPGGGTEVQLLLLHRNEDSS